MPPGGSLALNAIKRLAILADREGRFGKGWGLGMARVRTASSRRRLLALATAVTLGVLAGPALGQSTYPDRPVHIPVGFVPGSGADTLTRFIAKQLEALAGQPFIIDNRPGANGLIAMRTAAMAKPDGYTLLFNANSGIVGSRFLYKDAGVDGIDSFESAGLFAQIGFILVVSPKSPADTVAGLVKHLKDKNDNNYAFTNTTGQLSGELFKQMTGVPAVMIAYKTTADAMRDLLEGSLDYSIMDGTFAAPHVKSGFLKGLAVTSGKRLATIPDVPTMAEAGIKDFEFAPWWGIWAPKGTPRDIIDKYTAWLKVITAKAETAEFLEKIASVPINDTPAEVKVRLDQELKRWPPLIKAAGIVPE